MTPREEILWKAIDRIINKRPPGYGGDREVGWIVEVAQAAINLFDKFGQADEIKDGPSVEDRAALLNRVIKPCRDCGETPKPEKIPNPPDGWVVACQCYEPRLELRIRQPNPVTHTEVDEFMHGAIAKWNKNWGVE